MAILLGRKTAANGLLMSQFNTDQTTSVFFDIFHQWNPCVFIPMTDLNITALKHLDEALQVVDVRLE